MGRRRKPISSVQLGAAIHRTVHPAQPPDTDRVATQHSLLRTPRTSSPPDTTSTRYTSNCHFRRARVAPDNSQSIFAAFLKISCMAIGPIGRGGPVMESAQQPDSTAGSFQSRRRCRSGEWSSALPNGLACLDYGVDSTTVSKGER
jgi:hypothetical protein